MFTDTKDFIEYSRNKHGDKYDYSLVDYKNTRTKVTIICPIHGTSEQYPNNHIKTYGCPTCGNKATTPKNKKTTQDFIKEAKAVHGNKYDYSEVEYKNSKEKVTITCPIHGKFKQQPNVHTKTNGCPKCGTESFTPKGKRTTEDFIKEAKSIHGDKYDYSLTKYIHAKEKVTIICPEHGPFEQEAYSHLKGRHCRKCHYKKFCGTNKLSQEEAIRKFREVHGDRFDYSKVKYIRANKKVTIICPIHGEFEQSPADHFTNGCKKCSFENLGKIRTLDSSVWLERFKEVHGNKFDYTESNIERSTDKIAIMCPVHGEFKQTPADHLIHNCPKCSLAKVVSNKEQEVVDYITSIYSGTIKTSNRQIIKPKELDIVLPELNVAIEFDGLYWHSDQTNTLPQYHLNKTKSCLKKCYQLIHIFEDEWTNKQEATKLLLKQIIAPNLIPDLPNNITISTPSNQNYKDFLNTYHIEGYTSSDITYIITHNNALIAAIGLSYSKDDALVIDRFVSTHNETQSLSKLITYLQDQHPSLSIKSKVDRRFSEGKLFKESGFIHTQTHKPQEHYINGSERITKDILENSPKIWDCGYHIYTLKDNYMINEQTENAMKEAEELAKNNQGYDNIQDLLDSLNCE